MMVDDVQKLLDRYTAWLKDKTTVRQVEDWVEITTPYLDRHNDCLQIYSKRENGGYLLTDDGYTLEDLKQSGCSLDTPKREALLRLTINGFGVQLKNETLQVHAGEQNFALRKHNLVQAMLAVNDLFYLTVPAGISLFYEEVVSWLDAADVRYTTGAKFTGRSGYDHHFDFVIPKSRKAPERIVETINRPSKETAQSLAFSWIDTKDVRPPSSRIYAILNDTEGRAPASAVDALRNYDVKPVLWSEREEVKEELAA